MNYQPAVELLLAALPATEAIYLFGSRARRDEHLASDIDLAVLTFEPVEPLRRFDLQERVARCLGVQVDLVDLRSASTVLQVQVIEHGEVLFQRDIGRREAFEVFVLASYARLNEERRAILDDVRSRGSVY